MIGHHKKQTYARHDTAQESGALFEAMLLSTIDYCHFCWFHRWAKYGPHEAQCQSTSKRWPSL